MLNFLQFLKHFLNKWEKELSILSLLSKKDFNFTHFVTKKIEIHLILITKIGDFDKLEIIFSLNK